MKDKIINEIASNMVDILNNEQLEKLKDALEYSLHNCNIVQSKTEAKVLNNDKFLELLGHTKIDTTMQYAMVDQNNVKNSYRKYLD